jgi:hypothetical protein
MDSSPWLHLRFLFGELNMSRRCVSSGLLCLCGLFTIALANPGLTVTENANAQDGGGKVSGIVIDKRDNWIKVKTDGEKDASTYDVDGSDKKLQKALGVIFSVARVQLAYKMNGDKRQLVSIERTGAKGPGKITGVVVAVHEWWVEVKPKNGPPEGYAATYPAEQWKKTVEQIKALQKGDTVAIQYYVDGERNRIQSIQKSEK